MRWVIWLILWMWTASFVILYPDWWVMIVATGLLLTVILL